MAETTSERTRSEFVERVPDLKNRKWAGMPIEAAAAVAGDILKRGAPAISEIIGGLQEVDDGRDWEERLLLNLLVTHTSGEAAREDRRLLGEAVVGALSAEIPAAVKTFLVQQMGLFADQSALAGLAPLLESEDPPLVDAVCATMVSIGPSSRSVLEAAKGAAGEHARRAIQHALHLLS